MIKKIVAMTLMITTVGALLTGCFSFGGSSYGASSTNPPQRDFDGVDAFLEAVAAAKADPSAADETGLGSLEYYYGLAAQPEGFELSSVMAAATVLRVEYALGPVDEEKFENRIQIGWYRTAKASDFLSEMAQNLGNNYDVVTAGGIDYLHVVPDIQLASTATPENSAAATPTPQIVQYCQFVYWVQDDACFMAALPLGFTSEDIGKYCRGVKIPID